MTQAVHAFVDGAYLREVANDHSLPWVDPRRLANYMLASLWTSEDHAARPEADGYRLEVLGRRLDAEEAAAYLGLQRNESPPGRPHPPSTYQAANDEGALRAATPAAVESENEKGAVSSAF